MGESTDIAWTDHTFNPWHGCVKVSPGCNNCYAEAFSKRIGLKIWGQRADRRFFSDQHWAEPLKWNRNAEKAGERRRVFCASMADVFEDRRDLDEHRFRLWKLIEETPGLDWQLLTKRPENHDMVPLAWQTGSRRPTNVWLGCTVEDQQRASERVSHLLTAPWPAVRFLSMEPLLEDVPGMFTGVDWCIIGGESGPKARPFHIEWARSLVRRCRAAGVAPFVKQLGAHVRCRNDNGWGDGDEFSWPEGIDWPDRVEHGVTGAVDLGYQGAPVRVRLDDPKGSDWLEWPKDLRVREFPEVRR